jgi:hypothetical protein
MIDPNHRRLATAAKTPGFVSRYEGGWRVSLAACLAFGVVSLGGCDHPAFNCSGENYRGGCLPAAEGYAATPPPTPVNVVPSGPSIPAAGVTPAAVAPAVVPRGDPATFADVDDRQCRSYGLIFGSRDYADCRIRLSAQHRGFDPNTGVTTPGQSGR